MERYYTKKRYDNKERNMDKIRNKPIARLFVLLLCSVFCAFMAKAANQQKDEGDKIRFDPELQFTKIPEPDTPPARVSGIKPEIIRYCPDRSRMGSKNYEEYELYLDKFVVWCSDSAATVSAIGNPKFITSIEYIPDYGWEIRVNTSDVRKGKALRDKLRKMAGVQGVENYGYPSEGHELVPSNGVCVGLYELSDSVRLKQIVDSLGLIAHPDEGYKWIWIVRPKAGVKFNRLDILKTLLDREMFSICSLDWVTKGVVYQAFTLDPYVKEQWGLYNCADVSRPNEFKYTDLDVSRAWDIATGHGVKICLIDYYFDGNNEDLKSKIYACHDCSTGKDKITEGRIESDSAFFDNSHGTACAGIAAATRNNKFGISGIAPDAELILVRISRRSAVVDGLFLSVEKQLAAAIKWGVNAGADIISCSMSYSGNSSSINEAVNYALTNGRNQKGCVFICAAGNNGDTDGIIQTPGKLDGVLAIGALNKDLTRYRKSNFGEALFAMGPGSDICSLAVEVGDYKRPIYEYFEGTSYACPAVAGVAAMILEVFPDAEAAQVREIIGSTCQLPAGVSATTVKDYGPWNSKYGYGLVNAFEAVRKAVAMQASGYSVPVIPYPVVEN